VRVIAGEAKGTRLGPVPGGTRPVSDRAREGVFSSLGAGVRGARVLDLFAGTGAMGIEALSRGAAEAVFVDSSPAAVRTIRANLERTGFGSRASVRRARAAAALRRGGAFDLVLLDPPYALPGPEVDALLDEIAGQGVGRPGALVVLTRPSKGYMPVIPLNLSLERRLSYGDTAVLMFRVPEQQ
jgi:16S rRNA (guanine966-N2)-methyltransferase